MDSTKPVYQSMTLWAAISVIVVQIFSVVGAAVSAEDVMSITSYVDNILTSAAAIAAIYGRLRAEDKLSTKLY